MRSMNILLNSMKKVNQFQKLAENFDGKLILATKNFRVNAKSVLGIYSLDLSHELELQAEGDETYERLYETFKRFCQSSKRDVG